MIEDRLYWTTVTVTCEADPTKGDVLRRCYVAKARDGPLLHLYECGALADGRKPRACSYGLVGLVDVTSTRLVFDAYWWAGYPRDEMLKVPVRITCEGPRTREELT